MKYECPFQWKAGLAGTGLAVNSLDIDCILNVRGNLAMNLNVPTGHGSKNPKLSTKGCGGNDLPSSTDQAGWVKLQKFDGTIMYVPYWS